MNGNGRLRWGQAAIAATGLLVGFAGGAFTAGRSSGALEARVVMDEQAIAAHISTPYHQGVPGVVAEITRGQSSAILDLSQRITALEVEVRGMREEMRRGR